MSGGRAGAASGVIKLRDIDGGGGAACKAILDELPTWFGIPEANAAYVQSVAAHPGVVASIQGDDVGITTVKHHTAFAAEIHLMAVKPAHHRVGIGRAILMRVEERLAAAEPSSFRSRPGATATPSRATPRRAPSDWPPASVHSEFPTLWDHASPALQPIKDVTPTSSARPRTKAKRRPWLEVAPQGHLRGDTELEGPIWRAMEPAWESCCAGSVGIGAVLTRHGEIIATGRTGSPIRPGRRRPPLLVAGAR